ncbi:LacI family DNA-binding transcriptional regulator [Caproiciproducens sp. LBM24188]|nr:LacI family DNA-binding transcriptional regulator [Oscillospiraceae bacterium]HHV31365.1 substrate-binding domain-containing protein [Clostridiales bacterium]
MSITIREIAKMANVSRGTVDRVLNCRGGVNREVELRVRKIAEDFGYKPNRAGKALAARKKPYHIGCLLPGIDNPFFDDVISGMRAAEREYSDYGLSLEIQMIKGYDAQTHLEAMENLAGKGVDALCLTTVDVPSVSAKINEFGKAGLPVVTVNSDVRGTTRLFYVGCNYLKSGQTAAGMLSLMLGETGNTLIVTGSLKMQGHNQRIQGFSSAIKEKNLRISVADIVESQDDDDTAYRYTKEILQANLTINSIYITAAGVAGVCRAVEELDLAKKLRLIAVDDVPATREAIQSGTIDATICQEPYQQGYRAVKLLFNYFIEGVIPKDGTVFTDNVIKIQENLF